MKPDSNKAQKYPPITKTIPNWNKTYQNMAENKSQPIIWDCKLCDAPVEFMGQHYVSIDKFDAKILEYLLSLH